VTSREKFGTEIARGLVVLGVVGIPLGWGVYGLFVTLAGFVIQLAVFTVVRRRVRG
jgi:NaMN:DMB phosphoribosyltransferase